MFYRYISPFSVEPFEGPCLRLGGRVYVNPGEAVLRRAGYKPLQAQEASCPDGRIPYYTDGEVIGVQYVEGGEA